jgi:hypothetical protein
MIFAFAAARASPVRWRLRLRRRLQQHPLIARNPEKAMKATKRTMFTAALTAVLVTTTAAVFAQDSYVDPYTLTNRAPGNAVARDGDVSVGATIRTDERYNKGGLFSGPRGWIYWNYLADPQGYQNPNLWPDKRPTYFFGEMFIPAGSDLTVHGRFPHVRFFNFSIYLFERNTFVNATGGSIDGYDMEPGVHQSLPRGCRPGRGEPQFHDPHHH